MKKSSMINPYSSRIDLYLGKRIKIGKFRITPEEILVVQEHLVYHPPFRDVYGRVGTEGRRARIILEVPLKDILGYRSIHSRDGLPPKERLRIAEKIRLEGLPPEIESNLWRNLALGEFIGLSDSLDSL